MWNTKEYELLVTLLTLAILCSSASAQYWFQSGVKGGSASVNNHGASVNIQTIIPQNLNSGSLAFWVGETLSNGAFLQAGYVIQNSTGSYPLDCDMNGCYNYSMLSAGHAEWFYEYFPAGFNASFLGKLGLDNSAGANGTVHTYGFYASGTKWYFTMDGKTLGSIDLGTSTSGYNVPVAFGEIANTDTNSQFVTPVQLSNLSFYDGSRFSPVRKGYAYIGYGEGSAKTLKNTYGVEEIGNRINFFQIGSGLRITANDTQLWSLGYTLTINSQYANISNFTGYSAYSTQRISAPQYVELGNNTRARFAGWIGTGSGSYTGNSNITTVNMRSNITETAKWITQYYVGANTPYGSVNGSGWYDSGTTAHVSLESTTHQLTPTSRFSFVKWSDGNDSPSRSILVGKPYSLIARWNMQYLVNLSSNNKNSRPIGSGWYYANTTANITVNNTSFNENGKEYGFYEWNGSYSTLLQKPASSIYVNKSYSLTAEFFPIRNVTFNVVGENNKPLDNVILLINDRTYSQKGTLFTGVEYAATKAYYNGVNMTFQQLFSVESSNVTIRIPVYSVSVKTLDIFDVPFNTSVTVNFENGSVYSGYTGKNGTITFNSVPHGNLTAKINYFGFELSAGAVAGGAASFNLISTYDFMLAILIIAVIVIVALVSRHYFTGKRAA